MTWEDFFFQGTGLVLTLVIIDWLIGQLWFFFIKDEILKKWAQWFSVSQSSPSISSPLSPNLNLFSSYWNRQQGIAGQDHLSSASIPWKIRMGLIYFAQMHVVQTSHLQFVNLKTDLIKANTVDYHNNPCHREQIHSQPKCARNSCASFMQMLEAFSKFLTVATLQRISYNNTATWLWTKYVSSSFFLLVCVNCPFNAPVLFSSPVQCGAASARGRIQQEKPKRIMLLPETGVWRSHF